MANSHGRPPVIDGQRKLVIDPRLFSARSPDDLIKAVDHLKRSAEIVSRLVLQCPETPEVMDLRLEALSDLCISARQLSDDETFRSLFDMALLHASNRLYAASPERLAEGVIATTQGPRIGDAGMDI